VAWFRHSESIIKDLVIVLVLSVLFYVAGFAWIQHRRVAKGPWEVTFVSDSAGQPSILIAQRTLNISQKLEFPDVRIHRANLDVGVKFGEAVTNLPFGEMMFQDPLFLPGTATMRLFGHVVELLPRVLIIDDQEQAWGSGREIVIHGRTG
jgi:hypothetical protein